ELEDVDAFEEVLEAGAVRGAGAPLDDDARLLDGDGDGGKDGARPVSPGLLGAGGDAVDARHGAGEARLVECAPGCEEAGETRHVAAVPRFVPRQAETPELVGPLAHRCRYSCATRGRLQPGRRLAG